MMNTRMTPPMKTGFALFRLVLCLTGPVAIWLSWRWTGTADGLAPFDGFMTAARALAGFGATAFVIACVIALLRISGDTLIARLARAAHASGWLVLYLLIIGPSAYLIAPVLAIVATLVYDLLRPTTGDALSASARPIALIGQALALTASGLPLIAAPLGWISSDIALYAWIALLWLAAAFTLHRFLPKPMQGHG
ncbi:hypothetical protein [Maricaulis sp.]|uniref:hypothetical protein n=1 Tax=Maricaulis sp. TaxID=1486257 RepID=UPI002B269A12|nr:hypothetical protein [Maricaulis sp.]